MRARHPSAIARALGGHSSSPARRSVLGPGASSGRAEAAAAPAAARRHAPPDALRAADAGRHGDGVPRRRPRGDWPRAAKYLDTKLSADRRRGTRARVEGAARPRADGRSQPAEPQAGGRAGRAGRQGPRTGRLDRAPQSGKLDILLVRVRYADEPPLLAVRARDAARRAGRLPRSTSRRSSRPGCRSRSSRATASGTACGRGS